MRFLPMSMLITGIAITFPIMSPSPHILGFVCSLPKCKVALANSVACLVAGETSRELVLTETQAQHTESKHSECLGICS